MTFLDVAMLVAITMVFTAVIVVCVLVWKRKFMRKMQENHKQGNIQATKFERPMSERMPYTIREQHNSSKGITPPNNARSNVTSAQARRNEQSRNQLMKQTMLQSEFVRDISLDNSYTQHTHNSYNHDSTPSHSNHNSCSSGGSSYDSSSSSSYSSSSSSDSGSSSGGCD